MGTEDYRRILDFFFSGVEVSDDLRDKYLGWLLAHGDEPEVKALLEEYWNSVSSDSPEFDLNAGLERLMSSLEQTGGGTSTVVDASGTTKENEYSIEESAGTPVKTGWLDRLTGRKVLRWSMAAAAAVVMFIGGAAVSRLVMTPEKETVLVSSADCSGSYTLPDGTSVWLNRDSRLTYNQSFGKRTRSVSIDGEGYFEVTRNESVPFVVNMHDNLQVKVLGTRFNVVSNLADHSAEVILRSGSVQVSDSESKELVILKPDQKYSWDRGVTEVTAVNAGECCRWYERRQVFDNARLGDILESLSHKYQVRITCYAAGLADKRMSLTVQEESVDDVLEVLSTLLPLRWEHRGKTIIIDNKTKQI